MRIKRMMKIVCQNKETLARGGGGGASNPPMKTIKQTRKPAAFSKMRNRSEKIAHLHLNYNFLLIIFLMFIHKSKQHIRKLMKYVGVKKNILNSRITQRQEQVANLELLHGCSIQTHVCIK